MGIWNKIFSESNRKISFKVNIHTLESEYKITSMGKKSKIDSLRRKLQQAQCTGSPITIYDNFGNCNSIANVRTFSIERMDENA